MAIIQAPSGPGLTQTLLEILVNKQRMEQASEELKLRKQDFQLRQEESIRQAEMQKAAMQGASAAAQFFTQTMGKSAQGMGKSLPNAMEGVPQAGQTAFIESLLGLRQGMAQTRGAEANATVAEGTTGARITEAGAGARQAVSAANVAEATQGSAISLAQSQAAKAASDARVAGATESARIESTNLAPEIQRANLTDTNLRNQIQSKVLANDPQRGALALRGWIESNGQMTWAQAKEAAGLTTEDSIDPNLRYQSPSNLGADAQRANAFLPFLVETNQNINALHQQGVRLSLPGAFQKFTRLGSVDALLNMANSEEQRQLIQAQRAFSDMYRFSLSGQQSSDAERLSMMMSITEQAGDDDATIAQKRRLREVMINTVRARAGGGLNPLAAAEQALRFARELGDEDITSAFEGLVEDVTRDLEGAPSALPTGPGGIGAVPDLVRRGIGGGG